MSCLHEGALLLQIFYRVNLKTDKTFSGWNIIGLAYGNGLSRKFNNKRDNDN